MSGLPQGPLVAWYGDDFTGAAATMEAMSFAGLPAAVFLDPPGPDMLARFPGLRGIGIAGTARAQTPDWMRARLPDIFRALAATDAPLLQYKICSTLDSAPQIGSIGAAMEVARETLGTRLFPILPAAPTMGRYQAFGTLFASAPGGIYRLDRHPVMSRHPTTPMGEADVARHLAEQTTLPLANLMLAELHGGTAAARLAQWRQDGPMGVTLDAVTEADLAEIGRLVWALRGSDLLCVASQGLQYALLAHWRAEGVLPPAPPGLSAGRAGPIAVVSGSVSPVTAGQIAHAEAAGFSIIPLDPRALVETPGPAVAAAVAAALPLIGAGSDVLFCTARGPDDPAVARFTRWAAERDMPPAALSQALGAGLGDILRQIVRTTGLRRAVISGGDTSGHAARRLGLFALTALAPTIPGASLCTAHAHDSAIHGLQLALKGGQMGTEDYFSWIRDGGGLRRHSHLV